MTDREKLARVAVSFRELSALQTQQRETTAMMVRACLSKLKSNSSKDRREAMDALANLADILEGKEA